MALIKDANRTKKLKSWSEWEALLPGRSDKHISNHYTDVIQARIECPSF